VLFVLFVFCSTSIVSFAIEDVAQNSDITMDDKQINTLVGKIDFDDVVKKAQEHSYDLKIADYNILISKQGIRSARSEYFPKLNLGGGIEYTRNYRDIKDTTVMSIGDAFVNPYTRYQSILGITVSYNLFDFGIRGDTLKMAKEDKELKELELKEKFQELNLTLLDTYTKILITTNQIELNKKILKLEEKNLEMKERLFKAKEISKTELNDETIKIKTIKNKIADLYSIRQEALNWLSFYTGEEYNLDEIKVSEIKKTNFDVNSFQDYSKSITWKIHEKNIKKKEFELQIAKKAYYPKVNAYGRYYMYGSDHNNYAESLGIEPSNFSVGASVNMPIFDGFKISADIKKTDFELKQLHIERDKAIAQLSTRLSVMRQNLVYLDEQINENNLILNELKNKENSIKKLASKKLATPIEANEVKIEFLNQEIELNKNSITQNAITKGIEILTEEIKNDN